MFKRTRPPLCKDCVHFKPDNDNIEGLSKCYRKVIITQSLITGDTLTQIKGEFEYCDLERKYNWIVSRIGLQNCGRSGRYFKAKIDKPIKTDTTKEAIYSEEYGKE